MIHEEPLSFKGVNNQQLNAEREDQNLSLAFWPQPFQYSFELMHENGFQISHISSLVNVRADANSKKYGPRTDSALPGNITC
jgi:hypothetical protein